MKYKHFLFDSNSKRCLMNDAVENETIFFIRILFKVFIIAIEIHVLMFSVFK